MLSLPLSGWLMSSASPLQVDYGISNMVFGLFEMPDPFSSGSKVLSEQFKLIHEVSGNVLIALLILHAAAAGKHLFILKDNIVQRMTWGK
jgi:cytochrome b561